MDWIKLIAALHHAAVVATAESAEAETKGQTTAAICTGAAALVFVGLARAFAAGADLGDEHADVKVQPRERRDG